MSSPKSVPSAISRGSNATLALRTIVTARLPVRMTASDGTTQSVDCGPATARRSSIPGIELAGLVVDLESGLERARRAADLGQDFLQLAFERLRRIGLQRSP